MFPLDDTTFSAPASQHEFAALLFDMDGTIIDSTPAIVAHWREVGKEIGVDGDVILQTSHGRRSIDVLAQWAPHLANWEHIVPLEAAIPRKHGDAAIALPGARALLAQLSALPSLPSPSPSSSLPSSAVPSPSPSLSSPSPQPPPVWAIVTSGTRKLVQGWLDVLALPPPRILVSAEDVAKGKPDPACYALGAEKVAQASRGWAQRESDRVLVLEDAPAGIRAGKAAGFRVVAVATTHGVGELRAAGADWIVRDLRSVRVVGYDEGEKLVKVELTEALVG